MTCFGRIDPTTPSDSDEVPALWLKTTVRATLPNVGGITEMMKIAAICETHFVGIVPHFTGPIATAALVNSLGTFSGRRCGIRPKSLVR